MQLLRYKHVYLSLLDAILHCIDWCVREFGGSSRQYQRDATSMLQPET